MKKILLIIFLMLLIILCGKKQLVAQSYWQNPLPKGNALGCVKFISPTTGWLGCWWIWYGNQNARWRINLESKDMWNYK